MLAALAAGCKSDEPSANIGAIADASYGGAPDRGVTGDLPDLNVQGDGPDANLSGGTGSTPVGGSDASDDRMGNRPPDAPGPPDAAGANDCNLLRQDCTGSRGCYPAAASGSAGTCKPAGGFVEQQPCELHEDCAPGLVCAEVLAGAGRLCEPICDSTAVRPCPDNRRCRPFGGSLVGSCEP